jgi:hypothetical protein
MAGMRKYGNKKTEVDGYVFDSKAEAARYQELKLMQQAGVISQLQRQWTFELQPAFTDNEGKRQAAIRWVADFTYTEGGKVIAEDVKGMVTQVFSIKARLFRYKYRDVELRIVK